MVKGIQRVRPYATSSSRHLRWVSDSKIRPGGQSRLGRRPTSSQINLRCLRCNLIATGYRPERRTWCCGAHIRCADSTSPSRTAEGHTRRLGAAKFFAFSPSFLVVLLHLLFSLRGHISAFCILLAGPTHLRYDSAQRSTSRRKESRLNRLPYPHKLSWQLGQTPWRFHQLQHPTCSICQTSFSRFLRRICPFGKYANSAVHVADSCSAVQCWQAGASRHGAVWNATAITRLKLCLHGLSAAVARLTTPRKKMKVRDDSLGCSEGREVGK